MIIIPEHLGNILFSSCAILIALAAYQLKKQLDRQRQQRQVLTSVTLKISQTEALSQILQASVSGVREVLNCDRTLICRVNSDGTGTVINECVLPQWSVGLGYQIKEIDLKEKVQGDRQEQRGQLIDAIDWQRHEQFCVKSALIVPIFDSDPFHSTTLTLWGLLIAHHCKKGHHWQPDETEFLDELALHITIAVQQTKLASELKLIIQEHQSIEHQLQDRVLEIEKVNTQFIQTTSLLETRNQELDEFSYTASHDLQAPLRGIKNLTEWLIQDLEGQLSVESQKQLHLIQSRVSLMNLLIDGFLKYARVGRENVVFTTVNISQMLTEIIDLLSPPPEFQIQFLDDLPTIETQALLLKQVLANLIGNAIKYHDRATGTVCISLEDQELWLKFKVSDDGAGIAPENHKKVFSIFQTLAGKAEQKGTGIGLAIVKKIIEAQGGSITLESQLGQGSTFSFTWLKKLP